MANSIGDVGDVQDLVQTVISFLEGLGVKAEEIGRIAAGVADRVGYVLDPRVAAKHDVTTFLLGAGAGFVATKAFGGKR